jgi:hypothetical protein
MEHGGSDKSVHVRSVHQAGTHWSNSRDGRPALGSLPTPVGPQHGSQHVPEKNATYFSDPTQLFLLLPQHLFRYWTAIDSDLTERSSAKVVVNLGKSAFRTHVAYAKSRDIKLQPIWLGPESYSLDMPCNAFIEYEQSDDPQNTHKTIRCIVLNLRHPESFDRIRAADVGGCSKQKDSKIQKYVAPKSGCLMWRWSSSLVDTFYPLFFPLYANSDTLTLL